MRSLFVLWLLAMSFSACLGTEEDIEEEDGDYLGSPTLTKIVWLINGTICFACVPDHPTKPCKACFSLSDELPQPALAQSEEELPAPVLDSEEENLVAREAFRRFSKPKYSLPREFDWRLVKNRVTPVKKTVDCDSNWATVAAELIEGRLTDIGSNLVNISEITFQSCALDKPGCGRGDVRDAINLAIRWGKVYSVDKMTSLNGTKSACIGNNETDVDVSKIAGVYTAYDASPSFLKQLLFNDGPLAVTIRANRNFSNYTGGILKSKDCSARDSDRKIDALLVGYGVDYLDGPYWILKNSWGPEWGENGYFRVSRAKNSCGIGSRVYSIDLKAY